jgi:hypothetical protein
LSIIVLLAGAALLGLSGWFVTATGAAGVAGIGIAFDVFRPSAGVRMLALGRTAARYGERILTHDATLRSLARLRLRVLDGLATQPARDAGPLRSPAMLNRVTADVDALDGVAIRLVFPILAGGVTLVAAGAMLAWLVAPVVALWVVGTLATGAALAMIVEGRRAIAPAAEAEAARQALRSAAVEHLRARTILTFAGSLLSERAQVLAMTPRRGPPSAGLRGSTGAPRPWPRAAQCSPRRGRWRSVRKWRLKGDHSCRRSHRGLRGPRAGRGARAPPSRHRRDRSDARRRGAACTDARSTAGPAVKCRPCRRGRRASAYGASPWLHPARRQP